jgi:hypothetical protein
MSDLFPTVEDPKNPPKELMAQLRGMSMFELEGLTNALQTERTLLRNGQLVIQRVISERVTLESAARKLAMASDDERQVMLQLLQPKSIDSKESVPATGLKQE